MRKHVSLALLASATFYSLRSVAADSTPPPAATPDQSQLEQRLDRLTRELEELKAQLKEIKAQNTDLQVQQKRQAEQASQTAATVATVAAQTQTLASAPPSPFEKFNLWGYGEIYYTRPITNGQGPTQTTADLARAVLGVGYKFNDSTRFNSEFEVEHAVTSASDPGEYEVEQFYIEHRLNDSVSMNAGLFLIPAGLLNPAHEPTAFYGVQRNFTETLIIPSTWREGGVALFGDTAGGFSWNVGLTTGLNLAKWDFTPEFPLYNNALELENNDVAPMQATHQELALANGYKLSQYVALNYTGIPGVKIGGTYFTGGVVPAVPNINQRANLWEVHARWTPGKWDFQGVYAKGTFSNTAPANEQFPGTPNPLPAAFYGYYGQAVYTLWESGEQRLAPFVRAERYNMGAKYEGIAPGFSPVPEGPLPIAPGQFGIWPRPWDTVYTAGLNYYLTPNIVFKADYQKFQVNTGFTRIDLGMGLDF
jgi:hypothetical protein